MSSSRSLPGFQTNPVCRLNAATAETRGVFVVTAGDRAGAVISFVQQGLYISFGRSSDCTACFDSSSISRLHARAVWIADQHMISDAQSTNGTFVNGKAIQSAVLRTGDQVRLGPELTMRFNMVDADEERALVLAGEGNVRDPITGLVPHSYLEHCIDAELIKAKRASTPLSILLIAVDRWQEQHGEEDSAGGDLLTGLSWVLRSAIREGDTLGYFGDDRFMVIAPATALADAHDMAERLRVSVDAATFLGASRPAKPTISIGVASMACCTLLVDRVSLLFLAEQRTWLAGKRGNSVVSTGGSIASSLPCSTQEFTDTGTDARSVGGPSLRSG